MIGVPSRDRSAPGLWCGVLEILGDAIFLLALI